MRTITAIALSGLAFAGSAAAETRISDVDFIKASRCKALAASPVGAGVDTAQLDALLKSQGQTRPELILQKADEAAARAKRQARSADAQPRLSAELTGACAAYLGGGSAVASGQRTPPAS